MTKTLALRAIVLALLLGLPPMAQASISTDTTLWQKIGPWSVTTGHRQSTCLLERAAGNGRLLQLKRQIDRATYSLSVQYRYDATIDRRLVARPRSTVYRMEIVASFDPAARFSLSATTTGGLFNLPYFDVYRLGGDFMTAFARSEKLRVMEKGKLLAAFDIAGAPAALQALEDCHRTYQAMADFRKYAFAPAPERYLTPSDWRRRPPGATAFGAAGSDWDEILG